MQLYLVRHGESEGNAESIHQHARVVDGYPVRVNVSTCYEVAHSPAYSEETSAATITGTE